MKSYTQIKAGCKNIWKKNVAESKGNCHKNYLVFGQKLIETAKAYKYVLHLL